MQFRPDKKILVRKTKGQCFQRKLYILEIPARPAFKMCISDAYNTVKPFNRGLKGYFALTTNKLITSDRRDAKFIAM